MDSHIEPCKETLILFKDCGHIESGHIYHADDCIHSYGPPTETCRWWLYNELFQGPCRQIRLTQHMVYGGKCRCCSQGWEWSEGHRTTGRYRYDPETASVPAELRAQRLREFDALGQAEQERIDAEDEAKRIREEEERRVQRRLDGPARQLERQAKELEYEINRLSEPARRQAQECLDQAQRQAEELLEEARRTTRPARSQACKLRREAKLFRITTLVKESQEDDCLICKEGYSEDHVAVRTKACNHIFGKECLLEWLHRHKTCPTCRHKLRS